MTKVWFRCDRKNENMFVLNSIFSNSNRITANSDIYENLFTTN